MLSAGFSGPASFDYSSQGCLSLGLIYYWNSGLIREHECWDEGEMLKQNSLTLKGKVFPWYTVLHV